MEGVKLDELSSADAARLRAEYDSAHSPSSLSEESLQQLIEDLGMDVWYDLIPLGVLAAATCDLSTAQNAVWFSLTKTKTKMMKNEKITNSLTKTKTKTKNDENENETKTKK